MSDEALNLQVVGKVVSKRLESVRPNSWNPNEMSTFQKDSLRHGLLTDGWMASQALLVWGVDDKGCEQNVIIDGEHRWAAARELGFKKAPMVFLDGLTEAAAKALTVKMNAKRGKFQEEALGVLLRGIQFELGVPDLAIDLGLEQEDVMKFLSFVPDTIDLQGVGGPHEPVQQSPQGPPPPMQQGHITLVQLFYSKEQHQEFLGLLSRLGPVLGQKNTSENVLEALRLVSSNHPASD